MWSSSFCITVRSWARKLGINRLLGRVSAGRGYEDRFGAAMLSAIRLGDTVWDVGANVGLYTGKFLEAVGADGLVVAFEPTEACYAMIVQRLGNNARLKALPLALGDTVGTIRMALESDDLAATHRVLREGTSASGPTQAVRVSTGAVICRESPALFPNVIKVDVEGHEGAVFEGLQPMLADKRLRCIGVEMHFGLLEARNESATPRRIEDRLQMAGFRIAWTDPSHLIANRSMAP